MNISVSNKSLEHNIKENVIFFVRPIYLMAELPFNLMFDFFDGIKDILLTNANNKELREQNILLRKIYLESRDIKSENDNLKKLLNFKDSIKDDYYYLTSKIYSASKNGTSNELILNVSSDDGVSEGNLVFGVNRSVIGRIINVRNKYSNLLLLNDINSRIPARTALTKERIILSGTNKGYLEVSYFNSKTPNIVDGDFVFTSGDSDIIPDGFFIGTIKKDGNEYIVNMDENINSIFNVMVLIPSNSDK